MLTPKSIILRIMLPGILGIIAFWGTPAAISLAQAVGPLEPEFPVCPAGTAKVSEINGELILNSNPGDREHNYSFVVPDGYGPNGQLLIWQGEGHLWDDECTEGNDNDDPSKPRCDQDQQYEIGVFSVNSTFIGQFEDHTPQTDLNTDYAFTITNLVPGSNELLAAHINQGSGAQSVFYKGVVCAKPTSAATPDIAVEKTANPTSLPEPGGSVTFMVTITNTGEVSLTLTGLTDSIYGDLFDAANPNITNNTCDDLAGSALAVLGVVTCSFQGEVTGNTGDSETDVVTVTGEDANENEVTDTDDATVTIFDVEPSIQVEKTANPTTVLEPGGPVVFTVVITNPSIEPLTLISLDDTIYGDLFDAANPNVSNNLCDDLLNTVLDSLASTTCTFEGQVTGTAGDSETDVVTVTGRDDEDNEVNDSDDATVDIVGSQTPLIQVDKRVNPTILAEPGGTVTFTVIITNIGGVDLTLTALDDSIYGDLFDAANLGISNNTCDDLVGDLLAPSAFTTCTFQAEVTGNAGDSETDVVTVRGVDENENEVTDTDDATVTIVGVLLPAIQVDKSANPTLLPEPGGTVTFTVIIVNIGDVNLTLTALDDSVYGDLFGVPSADVSNNTCDALLGTLLAPDASTNCTFQAQVTGSAEDPPHVNIVTVTGRDNEGNEVTDDDDATVSLFPQVVLASVGDYVWLDQNLDGIQNDDGIQAEAAASVSGVEVRLYLDSALVATTTTNSQGLYLFTGLPPGNYSVEFVRPEGYVFTLANQGDDDELDSDTLAPLLQLSATAARNTVTAGDRLTYTIVYTNNGSAAAIDTTIYATVPQTTSFSVALNPGWTCEGGAVTPGTLCSISVGDVPVGGQGSVQFIVMVASEITGPATLVFEASIRDTANASHTSPVTLGENEVNLTLDAGLTLQSGVARAEVRTGVILPPTGSDPTDEPAPPSCGAQPCLFLPATSAES